MDTYKCFVDVDISGGGDSIMVEVVVSWHRYENVVSVVGLVKIVPSVEMQVKWHSRWYHEDYDDNLIGTGMIDIVEICVLGGYWVGVMVMETSV